MALFDGQRPFSSGVSFIGDVQGNRDQGGFPGVGGVGGLNQDGFEVSKSHEDVFAVHLLAVGSLPVLLKERNGEIFDGIRLRCHSSEIKQVYVIILQTKKVFSF